jgi:hypothetical protein
MASAQRREPRLPSLARLEPASNEDFRDELTACLALTAPVGMTEEARREWLSVAWITLKHLPADLLAWGCKEARETCDHPAKIVPAIIATTKASMASRRNAVSAEHGPRHPALAEPERCTPEEARKILDELGLKRDWSN